MHNEAKLKQMGLEGKPKFYYLKFGVDEHGNAGQGVATVCLLPCSSYVPTVNFTRGIAFCNPLDQFNRKLGRAIALGRAVKAIEWADSEPIPKRTPAWILNEHFGWAYLSAYDIKLTEHESKMFKEV